MVLILECSMAMRYLDQCWGNMDKPEVKEVVDFHVESLHCFLSQILDLFTLWVKMVPASRDSMAEHK